MTRLIPIAALGVACLASAALADLDVRFVEGAPTDRFSITNASGCALGPMELQIDLSGSAAGLIFDTTERGMGVQVFQPFRLVEGAELVSGTPDVGDGDRSVTLSLTGMAPGQTVAFTIDVDDTAGAREITVSGEEITGARVSDDATGNSAAFDGTGRARLPLAPCLS
ncbi:hypothetical protein [Cognatishimia sp. F0-27]|uniref:hypothetical protein n=1 Tax=Cognatishimia sp. F0-27 TaxID=2816855 RepID=UPI001D0C8BAB|nr:hypothetical protein [Cognatishimia sp. F0-27]MCC1492275.1 hypothetical protein [Cognatishimia sp. F0-27]